MSEKVIWTIGHSTHSISGFLELLKSHDISTVVDVRHFPGSRKYPHFGKDALRGSLSEAGIGYEHLESLGGRRKPYPDSKNTAWRHPAFRGYADYMTSEPFRAGMSDLQQIALKRRTACMCSEAVWWRCHRALISDLLKSLGWTVYHISSRLKATEHPFTSPAKLIGGRLSYDA